jgi:hypothetical protein
MTDVLFQLNNPPENESKIANRENGLKRQQEVHSLRFDSLDKLLVENESYYHKETNHLK